MHDPKLIEAMARAICCPGNLSCNCSSMSLAWRPEATAALTALCTLRPDVSAVLRGEAVVVPREATTEMLLAPLHVGLPWDQRDPLGALPGHRVMESRVDLRPTIYRAMLAASPYAQETTDAE